MDCVTFFFIRMCRCEKLEKNLEPLSEQVVNNDKSYTQPGVANHAYCG